MEKQIGRNTIQTDKRSTKGQKDRTEEKKAEKERQDRRTERQKRERQNDRKIEKQIDRHAMQLTRYTKIV